jgi:hypothetical protein
MLEEEVLGTRPCSDNNKSPFFPSPQYPRTFHFFYVRFVGFDDVRGVSTSYVNAEQNSNQRPRASVSGRRSGIA